MGSVGIVLVPYEVDDMFRVADLDLDGKISFEEFKSAYQDRISSFYTKIQSFNSEPSLM